MSSEDESQNLFDKLVSKKEMALSLSGLAIGGLVTIVLADYGSVAIGLKEVASLPSEVQAFGITVGTTLLGYIIGKNSNGSNT